jgi:hypothetical protein
MIKPLLLIAALLFGAATIRAQEAPWSSKITMRGLVSASYGYNFNDPASRTNTLRVFDQKDRSFTLDEAELVVQRDASAPGEVGFRMEILTGTVMPRVTASSGLFGNTNIDLPQAFVRYVAPLGSGLSVDAGKFATIAGYEVVDGPDGWNDNASRSFLCGYAMPFTHTGLRMGYGISDIVSATLLVANGWDNAVDNNNASTVGAQIALSPTAGVKVFVNGLYGAERGPGDMRSLADLVASWAVTERFTLAINGDYGSDRNGAGPDEDATWSGGALFLRYGISEHFALSLRGEQFSDPDGFRTGTKQTLQSVTLTPEFRPSPGFVLRADLRCDFSDTEVFEKGDSFEAGSTTPSVKQQPTVLLQALFVF